MGKIFFFALFVFASFVFAEADSDGEPSLEAERTAEEEELALVRDNYITALNIAMEDALSEAPDRWFELRKAGKFVFWADFEIEMPEGKLFKVTEIPYGFKIVSNSNSSDKASVKVVTRDSDIFYDIAYERKASENFKERMKNVFQNDRVVFYDPHSPCIRTAVSCLNEYKQGTLGILKK
ncbi:MAG: hypothetical protein M0P13_00860 [Fibrobacteraceae bacterium]|nr:hypothetical protein [Fibrobacteraceae bacterium]